MSTCMGARGGEFCVNSWIRADAAPRVSSSCVSSLYATAPVSFRATHATRKTDVRMTANEEYLQ